MSPALRIARIAESVYALIAFLFMLALPLPPQGAALLAWVHLLGTSLLAATLAWRLRRPSRATWLIAALLAAYVMLQAIPIAGEALAAWRGQAVARAGGEAVVLLPAGCQLVVAICLYRVRALASR